MHEPNTRVVLIDGKNFAYRFHWVCRSLSSRGRPTSLLYGGLRGLLSLDKKLPGATMIFIWDGEGRNTWRHKLAPEAYKSNRTGLANEEMRPVFEQIPKFRKLWQDLGHHEFTLDNFEADDLIGIFSDFLIKQEIADEVVIFSSDQDFYQLMSKRVKIVRGFEATLPISFVTEEFILEKFGVGSKDISKVRAITGDATDNIPHIRKGVGPKTAAGMVRSGVDPSKSKPPYALPGNEWLTEAWPAIHKNYKLTRIMRSPDDGFGVDEETKSDLHQILADIQDAPDANFFKDSELDLNDVRNELTDFIVDHEMAELFSKRTEILAIK